MMPLPASVDPIDEPIAGDLPFQAITLNGFLYRFNRVTGDCWQLMPSTSDKKVQVWAKIHDALAPIVAP